MFYCFLMLSLFSLSQCIIPKPDDVIGIWPFDEEAQLHDVSPDRVDDYMETSGHGKIADFVPGPYGAPRSSFTVKKPFTMIAHEHGIALTSEFTLAFHFYTRDCVYKGGILSFWEKNPRLAINYLRDSKTGGCLLEVWGGPANDHLLGQYPDIIQTRRWNYFAMTYHVDPAEGLDSNNRTCGHLKVFNQDGECLATMRTNLTTDPTYKAKNKRDDIEFYVGHTRWGWDGYYVASANMQPGDAIACVIYYKVALHGKEDMFKVSQICAPHNKLLLAYPQKSTTAIDFGTTKMYDYDSASSLKIENYLFHASLLWAYAQITNFY